jgi:hypothetical protein
MSSFTFGMLVIVRLAHAKFFKVLAGGRHHRLHQIPKRKFVGSSLVKSVKKRLAGAFIRCISPENLMRGNDSIIP